MGKDYTNILKNAFSNFDDEDLLAEQIMEFLKTASSFRNFGEGLKEITRKHMPDDYSGTEEEFLKKAAKAEGINLNRGTVKNWFSGVRPKKGEQSREHMYCISFALHMDISDTINLFEKVYLDKPFNMRDIKEFIYWYCIKNQFDYSHALQLIAEAEHANFSEREGTVYTSVMQEDMQILLSDEAVLDFIASHPHNFEINNRTAGEELKKLVNQIRVTRKDVDAWKAGKVRKYKSEYSYIIREIDTTDSYKSKQEKERERKEREARQEEERDEGNQFVGENKSFTAIETMLDIITLGTTRGDSIDFSGKNLLQESQLPKEIISRFPIKKSFSAKPDNLPFEELRKMIILLFSYKFWFERQYLEIEENNLEEFQMQLDLLLRKCGLQQLYYGNPYDWLFMFCANTDTPLDVFREIMSISGEAWN